MFNVLSNASKALTPEELTSLSKLLSFCLRHSPSRYGLTLDELGFVSVKLLHEAIQKQKGRQNTTVAQIMQVVASCPKQRYEVDDTKTLIRARYGHSVVKITYESKTPPDTLLHGTNTGVKDIILKEGLKPMGRQYVHLTTSSEMASTVGKRRGKLCLLKIDTKKAIEVGVEFYVEGEVWLATSIPPECLSII